MESETLRHFIGKDVEILVAGVWVEGHMTPIVKGVITLLPFADTAEFYGPTALKMEVVQAIRQVKRQKQVDTFVQPSTDGSVRSSLEQVSPAQRFMVKK
jgi:hypothetical protein